MRLVDHTRMPDPTRIDLETRLSGLGMLSDLIRWLSVSPNNGAILDVTVQDEFTHDVVVSLGSIFLVFDTT